MSFKQKSIFKAVMLGCLAQSVAAENLQESAKSIACDQKSPCNTRSINHAKEAAIDEVVVIKRREGDYSVITDSAQKIVDVPGALGDPLMAVFSLPGVLSVSEGGAPAVRGSSPSDNRYMVDGAPAGYVFHSFSTSIFNENIIQDFQLYSAGFGPSYSNAIGGVFDIRLRDPKHKPFTTKVDVSTLRAGVFFEGEVTASSAFYLSARGSVLQYLLDNSAKDDIEEEEGIRVQTVPQDSDYQFKYVYDINPKNKLTLSANGAEDLAEAEFTNVSTFVLENPDFAGDAQLKNSYDNASLAWRSELEDGSVLNLQLGMFVNKNDTFWGGNKYLFDLRNSDNYLTGHYDFILAEAHNITVGAEVYRIEYEYDARFINFVCTENDPDCAQRRGDLIDTSDSISLNEQSVYINDHWSLNNQVTIDIGAQIQHNNLSKETFYNPRFAASYAFNDSWTVNGSLGAYNRLPDIGKVFPEIGNPNLKSPTSNHATLGLKQLLEDGWSWSATVYYKTMDDLPLAMPVNQSPNYTNNLEGNAYGLDVFINKELTDKWYGWLALSTSKSTRTNKITHKETNYFLDTPVVLNLVTSYILNTNWTLAGRFAAQTGRAYTHIIGIQPNPYFANSILPVYGDAFSENLPTYSRLDLSAKRKVTFWGHEGSFSIEILNAMNRQNVTDRNLDYKKTLKSKSLKIKDEVGLGIIPALGVSISF